MDLAHYGVKRRSGRYPWGSGQDPHQHSGDLLSTIKDLKAKGLSETEIAKGLGMTTTQLRAQKSIAKNEKRKADVAMVARLKEKGMSNTAIGRRMGINESSVRALLDPTLKERAGSTEALAKELKKQVGKDGLLDVGLGVEVNMGVTSTKMKTATAMLEAEGYHVHKVKVQQQTTGKFTEMKVLVPPGMDYKTVLAKRGEIKAPGVNIEDRGRTVYGIEKPTAVSSKRLKVRYGNEGGTDMDGVIEVRRGVKDLSLGGSNYAQVRISVDGTHYLKGMAMYSDDIPKGYDLRFNTNKNPTGNKLDALKKQTGDPSNPFGSVIRKQLHYTDAHGKKKLSAMNIVNDEGTWGDWSKTLSSQFLSKQPVSLAKQQLQKVRDKRRAEFEEIMALTNPSVKKKLLQSFADSVDSDAVDLKAAALPRQASQVILPVPKMKTTEVYAPNFKHGEKVVLVRHPHGGRFEIPELTVNNKNPHARKAIGTKVKDAIGIHPKVAERLSGADFDGDSVLCIPNNSGKVKTSPALKGLKDFDPKAMYPAYPGMKPMTSKQKQMKMGEVSNLITDMTIGGANQAEIARWAYSNSPYPERMIYSASSSSRRRAITSSPESPGILISTMSTSGRCSRARRMPSMPLPAAPITSAPKSSHGVSRTIPCRCRGSSSITSTLIIMRSLLQVLQCKYCLRSLSLHRLQCDPAARIPVQNRPHMHIIKSEMIVVPACEHLPLTLRRHPMSVVLHAKDQMIDLLRSRDRNASTALRHLYAMLNRVFDERLEDQLRHIAAVNRRFHTYFDFETPLEASLLDLEVGAEKGQFLCHRHEILHADGGAQELSQLNGGVCRPLVVTEFCAPLDEIQRIIHKMRTNHLRE